MNFVQLPKGTDMESGLDMCPGINLDQIRKFEIILNDLDKDPNTVTAADVNIRLTWANGQQELFQDKAAITLAAVLANEAGKGQKALVGAVMAAKEEKSNGLGLH